MALVSCPECSYEVSDKAEACPKCGYGVARHFEGIEKEREEQERKKLWEEEQRGREARKAEELEKRLEKIEMPKEPRTPILSLTLITLLLLLLCKAVLFPLWADTDLEGARGAGALIVLLPLTAIVLSPCVFYKVVLDSYHQSMERYALARRDFDAYRAQVVADEDRSKEAAARAGGQVAANQVRCPKCGSAQIQMVQRKWDAVTGVFTNKVDRVCVSCKNKF